MFRNYPLLSRFTLLVLLPLLAGATALLLHLQSSRAQAEGRLQVRGLDGETTLTRDRDGAVAIRAGSAHDVYFAMGYAHAQDRLWQMEVQRRMAQGRLSEVFGRKTVKQDVWLRTLGLYRAAEKSLPALGSEARASLEAYAAGVNAWLAQGQALPPEFLALDVRPARWEPVDSLALVKLFALQLAGNLDQELERYAAAQVLDAAQMKSLYAGYPAQAPVTVRPGEQAGRQLAGLSQVQQSLQEQLQVGGRAVGSNAWVVAGRLTADGKPLLANDPHMGLQLPSLWYAVSQHSPELQVAGMSLPGMPVVVFGKNRDIAWGGTNMMADAQDLFFERIDPHDATRYQDGKEWRQFETRTEMVRVRAEFPHTLREPVAPLRIQVRESVHGVLVGDVVGSFDQPLALRWTALEEGDTTYESFFHLNRARDWTSFRAALRFHVAPALNLVYADQAGNIGYAGAGRVPLRAAGQGALPVPGWSGDYRWTGYIPPEAMPHALNPERGYLVSANNKVAGDDYPYFITGDWAPPARAARIEQMLAAEVAAGRKMTPATMEHMQGDLLNLEARQLLPLLAAYRGRNERQQRALAYLARWDGVMGMDSQAAAIYWAWTSHLRRELFGPSLRGFWNHEVQQGLLGAAAANAGAATVADALGAQKALWCRQPVAGNCDAALSKSLDSALDELQKLAGSDMDDWRWGSLHAIHFRHMPFSDVKLMDLVYGRQLASGGAPATVSVANASFQASKGYVQGFGAAFRQVMEPGAGPHLYLNSTGQSGHPLSRHYDDMIGATQYRSLAEANAAKGSVLALTPNPVQGN